jgi:hypothetical protein
MIVQSREAGSGRDDSHEVAAAAHDRLQRSPYRAVRSLSCDCRGGMLFLRGPLPTFHQKQLAQEAVANLAGVSQVINEAVVATPPGGGSTRIRMPDQPKQLVQGTRRSDDTVRARGGKRNRQTKSWQHPLNRHVRVPYRIAATTAVMEMGIPDYAVIAEAVGLTVEEVRRIDSAEDSSVRQLAVAGIPVGEFFKLVARVRCPRCGNDVGVAPCVGCCSY